ncbi:MAG: class I SAM-dependent methyltransferase [Candidatus Helarchaeota archaeon]
MIKKQVKATFELIAEKFDQVRRLPWPHLVNFIQDSGFMIDDKLGLVLDLGCGNGRHGRYILEKRKFDRSLLIIGVDIALNFLKIAKKNCDKIHYINADANYLPFKSHIFNRILYIATIHHIPKEEWRINSLLEVKRILTDDGLVLLTVWRLWQSRFYKYFLNELNAQKFKKWDGEFGDIYVPWHDQNKNVITKRFYHLFTIDEFKELIKKSEFRLIRSIIAGTKKEKGTIFALLTPQ